MGFSSGIYQLSKYSTAFHSSNELKYFKATKATVPSHLPELDKGRDVPRRDVRLYFIGNKRTFQAQPFWGSSVALCVINFVLGRGMGLT